MYLRPVLVLFVCVLTLLRVATGTAHAQTTWVIDDDGLGTSANCDAALAALASPAAALTVASSGDTILVCPGTYVGTVLFAGKAVTLRSIAGASVTILDGGASGSVVTFTHGEGRDSVLEGFTIRNGLATSRGGGIWVSSASPVIRGNVITANRGCVGAGISVEQSNALIERNTITANIQGGCSGATTGGGVLIAGNSTAVVRENTISFNSGVAFGGGIALNAAGSPTIERNVIIGNSALDEGGGISILNDANPDIVGNVIVRNQAPSGGGIYWLVPVASRGILLANNTIAENDSPNGSGIVADAFDGNAVVVNNTIVAKAGQIAVLCGSFNDLLIPAFRFNNVYSATGPEYSGICADQTGANGNISADPRFVDPAANDFHLQLTSPNIEAGDNEAAY
jgi:hypothetical protein